MSEYRIVEIRPGDFEIQSRNWFVWCKASYYTSDSLQEARARLADIRNAIEWVPKVYPA